MNAPASKTSYKLGKKWIDDLYPLVSNYDKFKEFIKLNGWEYNKKTKTGWQESKTIGEFRYRKDGNLVIDENLGVSKFQFDGRDKFMFAEINGNLNEYPSNSTKIQPVCVYSEDNLGLKFRITHCDMHYDLDSKDEHITISPPKKEEKMEEKKILLGTEWLETIYPQIDTLDKFLNFIKEKGESVVGTKDIVGKTSKAECWVFDSDYIGEIKTFWFESNDSSKLGLSRISFDKKTGKVRFVENFADKAGGKDFVDTIYTNLYKKELPSKDDYLLICRDNTLHYKVYNTVEKSTVGGKSENEVLEKKTKKQNLDGTWVENIYPHVSTLEKFKEFIKINGLEYDTKTGFGWKEEGSSYSYYKNHTIADCNTLGGSGISYLFQGSKFDYIKHHESTIEDKHSKQVMYIRQRFDKNNQPNVLELATNNKYQNAVYEYEFFNLNKKKWFKANNLIHADSIASQKEYKLGTEFIDEVIPRISSLDGFLTLIKDRGEEYDEKTKTGWLEHMSSYEYFEKGAPAVSSLGCNTVKFNSKKTLSCVTQNVNNINGIAYITVPDYSSYYNDFVKNNQEEFKNFYFCRTHDISKSSFYDTKAKKMIPCETIYATDQIKIIKTYLEENKRDLKPSSEETNKKEEKVNKLTGLDRTWVEKYFPSVANLNKFKEFIKANGLEYNKETKTGWEKYGHNKYRYYVNDKLTLCDTLGGSFICFNDNLDLFYIEHEASLISDPNKEQVRYISFYGNGNLLRIATNDKNYTKTSKNEYYSIKKKSFFKAESTEQAIRITNQKDYKLNSEFLNEMLPQISTLENFKSLIKARGEEYNEETKSGWQITEYSKIIVCKFLVDGVEKKVLSSLGADYVVFDNKDKDNKFLISENKITKDEKDFLYVRPLDSFLNKSLLDGIENISDLYFCRHEDIRKIEVYNSKTKEVIHCGSVYDSHIIEAVKAFQEEKKANKTNKEKQEVSKPKKELNIEWIKEIYPKVKTEKEFISFIKEIGEEYNKETGTGWVLAGLHPDNSWEYRGKNISQVSVSLGANHVSFNKEGEFLFAQDTIKGSDVITNQYSSSIDPNWIRLRTETYCKGFNLITGEVLTVDRGEYSKLYEMIKNHIPVLKLKINEVAPKNYTGIVENSFGIKIWLREGKRHRDDGPAIEWVDGSKEWYIEDKRHRIDGPAIERVNGDKLWYKEDKFHREDGPAVEWADGTKYWFKEGKLHRLDGPAVEYSSGNKEWWVEGKLHRIDSPAREFSNGTKEWWIEGKEYSEESFRKQFLKEPKLIQIAKSDAREVAKRVAVNEITKFVQLLVSNSIKENKLKLFLDSSNGRILFKLMIAGIIPILKQHMLPKYGEILDEVSQEFRIQGETEFVTEILDKVINSFIANSSFHLETKERIRIEIENEMNQTKSLQENFEETVNLSNFNSYLFKNN